MRFAVLLIIFTATSLIELAVLIEVSQYIGTWGTILLVIITAFVGTSILQRQGLNTLAGINQSLAQGVAPVEPLVEGLLLVIAGAFLLTPGIITDSIGFLLFVPPLRRLIAHWALRKFLTVATVHVRRSGHDGSQRHQQQWSHPDRQGQRPQSRRGGDIIDAEYERVDKEKTNHPSPEDDDR